MAAHRHGARKWEVTIALRQMVVRAHCFADTERHAVAAVRKAYPTAVRVTVRRKLAWR